MYFGCFEGLIVKYNGSEFIRYETERDIQFRSIWGFNDSTIYALGNKLVYLGDYRYNSIGGLYKYLDNGFVLVDSADHYDKGFRMDLWGYDENNFYSASDGVYKYVNNKWINEFYSWTIYSIFGSSPNNVFAGGYMTGLYHYNGDNWKKIKNIYQQDSFWGIWCKSNYIFALKDYDYYRIVLKGERKQ